MQNSGLWSKYWDALLATVLSAFALYLLTKHSGIGISPDSVEYITTAENIRQHGRMADFTGLLLVLFPAGYPCLLAAIQFITGLSVMAFAPVLNSLLFGGVLFATATIINGLEKTATWYRSLFLLALVLSRCMLQAYSMLWSETVFVLLILVFIIQAQRYLQQKTWRSLLLLSLITAITLVTRYAGVVLLAVGSILMLADETLGRKKKIQHLLVFNLTGASLLAANLIRNHFVSQSFTGVRERAERDLWDNLLDIGNTFGSWLPFMKGYEKAMAVLFIIVVLLALTVVVYRILQQQFFRSYEMALSLFFLVYALFMVTIATVSRFEELNSRLLLPLYIPMLLLLTGWFVPAVQSAFGIKKIILCALMFFLYASFQWYQYRQNANAWEDIKDAGIPGYTEDSWTQSETIDYIRKHKQELGSLVYANANDAIYFLTGMRADMLPHKDIQKEIEEFFSYPSFCVVMFTDGDNPDLVSIDFIQRHKKLLWQKSFEDGAIYYFSN
ncbi:MAG: hypothetical protein J0H85_09710 [Sediminibacterium magnilacihabitans]|jgi:hypothetical protein|nr:hypothetical protein [Sediminibacterium magnilacihabitans]PQV60108.1 hypothetical protein CLV53_11038 [Sediminibacterium magnilacihabitans]